MRYLDTEIRLMEERDLDKVLEIENLCFINPWKEKDMLYEMKENPLSNLWVIELSNDSLGLKTICTSVSFLKLCLRNSSNGDIPALNIKQILFR